MAAEKRKEISLSAEVRAAEVKQEAISIADEKHSNSLNDNLDAINIAEIDTSQKDVEKEKDASQIAAEAVPVTDVSAISTDKIKDTSKDKVKEKEVEKANDKEKDASKVPAAAAVPAIDESAVSTDKSKDTGKDKVKEKEVEKVSDKEKEKDVSKVATAAHLS